MLWPKKIHAKNLLTKKKFLRLENSPPPPITFLMVRPEDDGGVLSSKEGPRIQNAFKQLNASTKATRTGNG